MNILRPGFAPACVVAVLLLSACGGGGGPLVQATAPPPQPPPAPPPSPPDFDPCPAPVTSDCRVTLAAGEERDLPVTQSDRALILDGDGRLDLVEGRYRFGDGTRIEGGALRVQGELQSDVAVLPPGHLMVIGTIEGEVSSQGLVTLYGAIAGDLRNDGRVEASGAVYGNPQRVGGDFVQSGGGVLAFALAPAGWDSPAPLQVDGRAELDGVLELGLYTDAWGPYATPAARAHHIVHADGGVSGRFADWTSPGLAITGELRYGANDVWFDLARISVQAAMAARGVGRPLPLASAANLDRALAAADAFALAPQASLDDAQRRFLASASSLLWLQDTAQALRSFDSLAGHAHAAMRDLLHRRAAQASARLDARLARRDYDTAPLPWSGHARWQSAGHGLDGQSSGIDRWLSPRLLVGGSFGSGLASLRFDHLGGQGRAESPEAGVHAHYRGDGWHATGALGAGRTRLQLQRTIELGAAGRHLVHSQRNFRHAFVHGELGRDLPWGGGRLVPFVAFDYDLAHGASFAEQGATGLELVAGPSRQARFSGALGARYARDWRFGRHRLQLDLDARYRRGLVDGDPLQAAFRGVPGAWFDLPDPDEPGGGEVRMGLAGALGARTRWSLDYARGFGGGDRDEGWMLELRQAVRAF